MQHYLLLTVSTLIIFYLSLLTWKRTKQVAFLLGYAVLYYWTLLGAWFIVFDDLTGQKGKEIGLHYYHFFDRLFPVHADNIYLVAIALYSGFIILVQLTVLFFLKKGVNRVDVNAERKPVFIHHGIIICCCLLTTIISFSLVWKEILTAAKFGQSVYVITRHQPGRFFTIHQLLNQVSIVALYTGLITFISGDKARFIKGSTDRKYLLFYILAVILVEGFLLFLGNKREILFGGIMGILFYIANVDHRINYKALALFLVILMIPLFFNDGLRAYSPTFLTKYFDTTGLEYHPDMEIVYTEFSMKGAALTFLFSNEMFCAHFSMYGILSHHIPLTWGTSLVSLGASFAPHALWPNRPATVYDYYVDQVHAAPGQGYTIHHASAWYLNFGVLGVIAGAVILGWLWVTLYKKHLAVGVRPNGFLKLFFALGFASFTAQLPSLVRSGPEGYKAMFFEALLLPVLIIYAASRWGNRNTEKK
ncbi:MAG TPA: hypothetical protein VI112_07570 [Bacteroidia bacterium]|jgi:hypothetical protein